jgi:8-oxo-dGTP diphosphatase
MWEDDQYWLREALDGRSFTAWFVFDRERMVSKKICWR